MTTARARFLKRRLGRRFGGLDYRSLGRLALGDGPIDEPNQDDHAERELVDGNVAEEARDCDVRQGAERRVLAPTVTSLGHRKLISIATPHTSPRMLTIVPHWPRRNGAASFGHPRSRARRIA